MTSEGFRDSNVHELVMHGGVLQVRQRSIQHTIQHKYVSVLITGIGFSASEEDFILLSFLADHQNRLKAKICIDFHWLCSCVWATYQEIWNKIKENVHAAVSREEWWVTWWARTCLDFNTNWPLGNWKSL